MERALPLVCERLGLIGKADLVEIFPTGTPYPVEYKHGPRRQQTHDDVQLAAQAICLEEMTKVVVPAGAIYNVSSRHRREVAITQTLRELVAETTLAVRTMLESGQMPLAANDARCQKCSLIELCQPQISARDDQQRLLLDHLFSVED